ncbi:MAG TPA: phosphodiester glycosidase family protein [bacterium]|nr:phosphodiester glycosidase family protein [bacterium]
MKIRLICLLLLIALAEVMASLEFETVFQRTVGPGVTYERIIEATQPWRIDLLQLDLDNPNLQMESVKARDLLYGLEGTRSMAERKTRENHYVLAAINADFYNTLTGEPINAQVVNGELVRRPGTLSTIGFDRHNRPSLARTALTASVASGGQALPLNTVNATRQANFLVLYNSFFGASTQTNQWGTEVLVTPLTPWVINDTVYCRVDSIEVLRGNMAIPAGKAVLSGHDAAATFLQNHAQKGDTLSLYIGLLAHRPSLTQLLGGLPRIVHNGANWVDQGVTQEGGPDHAFQRHPRTAIGFSADSTRLFLITVDGRQDHSDGMTLPELADFMISRGVAEGLNFDGGGSTTMVVWDQIVNSPSDGFQRSVSNALLVVNTAPVGPVVALDIVPRAPRLVIGDTLRFTVIGLDSTFHPLELDPQALESEVDHPFAEINGTQLIAGAERDSGFVRFRVGGTIDSVFVGVKSIESIEILPRQVVVDTLTSFQFSARIFDSDGLLRTVQPVWSVQDSTVGLIAANGVFSARRSGTTRVFADYRSSVDTARVAVELGQGTAILDGLEDANNWSLTNLNCDSVATGLRLSAETVTWGNQALAIDYRFAYQPGVENWLYLHTDQLIYGLPDSMTIDFRLDSLMHSIYFIVATLQGDEFKLTPRRRPRDLEQYNLVGVNAQTPSAGDLTGPYYFPIRLKRIEIKLASTNKTGQIYSGTLFLDRLRVTYPQKFPAAVSDPAVLVPHSLHLWPAYPNPFNASTTIRFRLDGDLFLDVALYDVLGRQVRHLYAGRPGNGEHRLLVEAEDLATGVYFVHFQPFGQSPIKLLLIK